MTAVDVYYNLHKLVWSVRDRKTGRVGNYCRVVEFDGPVEFVVQPAGRAKTLREKRKSVHAFVRGSDPKIDTVTANDHHAREARSSGMVPVSYNPYVADHFYNRETGEPIYRARELIMFAPEGGRPQVWARL